MIPDPPRPRPRADQTTENTGQQLAALRYRLRARIRAIQTNEDWVAWLQLAARLPGYGFSNVLLIGAQQPDATLLADIPTWRAAGRQVNSAEPAIEIFGAASPEPGSAGRRQSRRHGAPPYTTRTPTIIRLWDITQTTGSAPGEPSSSPGKADPAQLWDALTWIARREGFAVEREYCDRTGSASLWDARRIRVSPSLRNVSAAQALLHQIAHLLLHAQDPPPAPPGSGCCRGLRKVETDSASFIVSAQFGLDVTGFSFASPAVWAGTDPRAGPAKAIHAAGTRIADAANAIARHINATVPATIHQGPAPEAASRHPTIRPSRTPSPETTPAPRAQPETPSNEAAAIRRVLLDAEYFYLTQVDNSWVPGYLKARGFDPAALTPWHIGYAPGGWATLLSHLRGLGHEIELIEAAGLARRSSRGTVIDVFRDRAMLPIRDEQGSLSGFIGRAPPAAPPAVPKYLNSPQTAVYAKGSILFGLHQARAYLAAGAQPVLVEGPFDAIAVTIAGPARYAGLAPCGTALTARQVEALASIADLRRTTVMVALDGDRAGRAGAIRAYELLLPHTSMPTAAVLPDGTDPAAVLEDHGSSALNAALGRPEPLARVVIDAFLDSQPWQLDHPQEQLTAMRAAATLIARTLSSEAATKIRQLARDRPVVTLGQHLDAVVSPELSAIARQLPPETICQIVRVAERTASDCSDITAELVNTSLGQARSPKDHRPRNQGDISPRFTPIPSDTSVMRLAAPNFPHSPDTGPLNAQSAWTARPSRRRSPARARQRQRTVPLTPLSREPGCKRTALPTWSPGGHSPSPATNASAN